MELVGKILQILVRTKRAKMRVSKIGGKVRFRFKPQKEITTMNEKNETMNEDLDIIKEFNSIL